MFSFKGHFQYINENDVPQKQYRLVSITGISGNTSHFGMQSYVKIVHHCSVFSLLLTVTVTSPPILSIQVILFLIMLVMRKRVALTIALFHVAGKVFIHLPLLVFQPFWTFFALVLFWAYWVMTLLFLGTTGKKTCRFLISGESDLH